MKCFLYLMCAIGSCCSLPKPSFDVDETSIADGFEANQSSLHDAFKMSTETGTGLDVVSRENGRYLSTFSPYVEINANNNNNNNSSSSTSALLEEDSSTSQPEWRRPQFNIPTFILASRFSAYDIGMAINKYWPPIIVPIGMIGNSLSLLVVSQKKNRHNPCCLLMAALAVSDNGLLYLVGHGWVVQEAWPESRQVKTKADWRAVRIECKALTYLFIFFSLSSAFFVIAMTANRLMAVVFPLKVKSLATMKTTRRVIAAIVVFNLCYSLPYIFPTDLLPNGLCVAFLNSGTLSQIYPWVSIGLNSALPFVSLMAMNLVIILAIRKGRSFVAKDDLVAASTRAASPRATTSPKTKINSSTQTSRDRQLTVMLMLVAFIFLLLSLPQYIRYLVFIFIDYNQDPQLYATYILTFMISNKMYLTTSAVNFFLYFLAGSKFRNDLRRLFGCGVRPGRLDHQNLSLGSISQTSTPSPEVSNDLRTVSTESSG